LFLKNAIKQEKEEPLDFSIAPSTPSKEFGQNPKNPSPGFLTTVHLAGNERWHLIEMAFRVENNGSMAIQMFADMIFGWLCGPSCCLCYLLPLPKSPGKC
jgi:hypothetical protein